MALETRTEANFNMGGIADSEYSGVRGSQSVMVGWDLHSKPGLLQVNQKLSKESASVIDEFVGAMVVASDGNTYEFSRDSGKIWKRDSGGTHTLVHTTTPDKGEAKCLGAEEYNGYIYWATEKRLHRIPISGTSNWGTNAEEDVAELNVDLDFGAVSDTYNVPTSISEASSDLKQITPAKSPYEAVAIYVQSKGTGNWTLTIHDSSNNTVASVTVLNVDLPASAGLHLFELSSLWYPVIGETYHIHLTSTVADGTVGTITNADFSTVRGISYTQSDSEFHPMRVQNQVLFIGDRNFVHQVESGVFTQDALDIERPYRVKSFGKFDTDLLIGTIIDNNIPKAQIYRWDTYSPSFANIDDVDEVGINAFIPADNDVIVSAGINGNLYFYNGAILIPMKTIPGNYSPTVYSRVHPNAVANFKGLPMFGFSNGSGNPTSQGVYSFGSRGYGYPRVLNLEFPVSERSDDEFVLSNIEIGAMAVVGNKLLVSWKNTSAGTYGVDAIDYGNKLEYAYFETRVWLIRRWQLNAYKHHMVDYASLPENTSIDISVKVNHANNYSPLTAHKYVDAKRMQVRCEQTLSAGAIQFKVQANSNGNNAPSIVDFVSTFER